MPKRLLKNMVLNIAPLTNKEVTKDENIDMVVIATRHDLHAP